MNKILKEKVGIKLELELINSLGERIGQSYVSQLIDVDDEHNITIAAPIHESRLMLITPGTRVRIIFLDERQGLLSFQGNITFREKKESIIALHVKINGTFEKIQRRNYFRLDCLLTVAYIPYNPEPQDENPEAAAIPPKKAVTRNISGNGASIVIQEELSKNSNIDLTIWLTKDVSIKVIAKVIRCNLIEGLKDKKYETGLYFTKMTQRDQDILVKYIFDQQRLLLKNNVIDKI